MEHTDRYGDHGELILDRHGETTYFAGRFSDARMNVIRKSIEDVRAQWSSQEGVPDDVRAFVASLDFGGRVGVTAADIIAPVEKSYALNRDWADRVGDEGTRTEFPMIRLYTSDVGYETLFAAINARYRSDAATDEHRPFVPLTWLVELLNMELFAASLADPGRVGDRIVYRGTVFPGHLLDRYQMFEDSTIALAERSVSIPLGLHSTTGHREIARDFIDRNMPRDGGRGHFGIIWNIHVIGLAKSRLDIYHRHFPESVVSAICATDISDMSAFEEAEALLRGPFFEMLSCRPVDPIAGLPVFELTAVMLNSNRDHASTFELGDRDAAARDLFRKLVSAEKYEGCARVAASLGKPDLAASYVATAERAEREAATADLQLSSGGR